MSELYILFAIIAVAIFAAIVGYSFWQEKRRESPKDGSSKSDYADPLFAKLEGSKASAKSKIKAGLAKVGLDGSSNANAPQKSAANTPEVAVSKAPVKKAPQMSAPSQPEPANLASDEGEGQAQDTNRTTKGAAKGPASETKTENQSIADYVPESSIQSQPSEALVGTDNSDSQSPVLGAPKVDSASSIVTELVARVKNPEPIEQKELLTLFRDYDFKFHRKVHIYGLNQLTEMWRDIEFELPSARYTELGVAIQLADREGAMSKKELHDFQQMALEFSNKFDAPFEFSMDIDEALNQAQILDQIGRRYDAMAVLNVVPRSKSGFRMADIESCARDLMMSTDKNGIYVKTKGQKQNLSILYRLACTDGSGHFGITSGAMTPVFDLVIYMNVPATGEPDRVFQDMVKDANNLATWLDGKVVDRNGKVMTQRSYSILMQQLSDITFSMQQDGLVPGDAVSKKLF